ncbi:MAG: thiamine-phosphate kinase [archaeon]
MGEFELIDWISRQFPDSGIGDDCAVIQLDRTQSMLYTTDTLVEQVHFRRAWFTWKEVGIKAIEQNVSDIAACGGIPRQALVSLQLPAKDEPAAKGIMRGIKHAAEKYGIKVIGGNITRASKISLSVFLIGHVKSDRLCMRSTAKPGQLLCVTGDLGKGAAGLLAFKKGADRSSINKHLRNPTARLDWSKEIAKHSCCMIDISDGLASEIRHIGAASGVGATIIAESLPLSKEANLAHNKYGVDPFKLALEGGDEYELLFTLAEENAELLDIPYTIIGRITEKSISLIKDGKNRRLGKGFTHF